MCPRCRGDKTIRKGVRRGKIKYHCKGCKKWFQINRVGKESVDRQLTLLHLDGVSFRSLADQFHISVGGAYTKVSTYLSRLPHCADITRKYCTRYCGILLVDGKYVKVKGYERKIPVLYGIDYTTHDIPTYVLSPAENYQTCLKFFSSLRLLNYPLQAVVCDDNTNIYEACRYVYPNAIVQLCQNHYKENIRRTLDLTVNQQYIPFMKHVEELFVRKRSPDDFNRFAKNILTQHTHIPLCTSIMLDIYNTQDLLCGWRKGHHIPTTTNLIESFNSHLQGRLKTIKGFESFIHANTWLNAYFLRRRTKKFTDCDSKFKYLNGSSSFQQSKKLTVKSCSFFN